MKYIHRELEKQLARATRNFPAVVLTGPRRAAKTMLLRRHFPKAAYFLLEDPDVVARLRADPHGFLDAVKTPTITQWLGVLETTAQILLIPPFFENLGKRLIKSPKLYLADSGLACHLLGLETPAELAKSVFSGALFEGFVASEIVKAQLNSGRRRELYWFRDQQGLEVDFVMPGRGGNVTLVECKATRTVTPAMAVSMQRLAEALRKHRSRGTTIELNLVHQSPNTPTATQAVAPGVRAWAWQDFVRQL